jgi:hypothetical protein
LKVKIFSKIPIGGIFNKKKEVNMGNNQASITFTSHSVKGAKFSSTSTKFYTASVSTELSLKLKMNHVSNSILVFGGFPGDNNEIYELSLENLEWTQINTSGVKPKARFGHGTFINHENMYIFGGEDQHGNKLNDLHSLNLETYEWNEISALGSLPAVRSGHSTKVHKHLMVLFGGERAGSGISLFKT